MSETITSSPTRRAMALQITCALMSNPALTDNLSLEEAADEALRLMNRLEQQLKIGRTTHQPAG